MTNPETPATDPADEFEALLAKLWHPAYWMCGSADGHEGETDVPHEAAAMIRALRATLTTRDAQLAEAVEALRAIAATDDSIGVAIGAVASCAPIARATLARIEAGR